MLLSSHDIELLERSGFQKKEFVRLNRHGFAQLKNKRNHCVFYDARKQSCKVYRVRPLGCRIYPVIYSVEEGVVVDDLCPQINTVSREELGLKAKKLARLLRKIDGEARKRCIH
jgi:Fe-S-cluster containining protein